MSPTQLHEYLLEKAGYDLPTSSIYRMIRQRRIKGERHPIPRSTRERWIVPQEEADALVIEFRELSPFLSPSLVLDRRPKSKKGENHE